jgi:hypothetical protein
MNVIFDTSDRYVYILAAFHATPIRHGNTKGEGRPTVSQLEEGISSNF